MFVVKAQPAARPLVWSLGARSQGPLNRKRQSSLLTSQRPNLEILGILRISNIPATGSLTMLRSSPVVLERLTSASYANCQSRPLSQIHQTRSYHPSLVCGYSRIWISSKVSSKRLYGGLRDNLLVRRPSSRHRLCDTHHLSSTRRLHTTIMLLRSLVCH